MGEQEAEGVAHSTSQSASHDVSLNELRPEPVGRAANKTDIIDTPVSTAHHVVSFTLILDICLNFEPSRRNDSNAYTRNEP